MAELLDVLARRRKAGGRGIDEGGDDCGLRHGSIRWRTVRKGKTEGARVHDKERGVEGGSLSISTTAGWPTTQHPLAGRTSSVHDMRLATNEDLGWARSCTCRAHRHNGLASFSFFCLYYLFILFSIPLHSR